MLGRSRFHADFSFRFRPFRRAVAALGLCFLLAYLLGALLYGKVILSAFGEQLVAQYRFGSPPGAPFWACVGKSYAGPLLRLLFPFVLGITLYGPFACGVCMLGAGLSGGAALGFLFRLAGQGLGYGTLACSVFCQLVSGWLLCLYCAFCTCVSLKQMGNIADGDRQMFGGTLFCANFHQRVINLRFLVSYLVLFLVFALLLFLLTLAEQGLILGVYSRFYS